MNKGRNILLVMICLLGVSFLSYFTLFERNNNQGVVGDVRYIVDSNTDGVKEISLYFVEPGESKALTATEDATGVSFTIDGSDYTYYYENESKEVTAISQDGTITTEGEAFSLYEKGLFKQIVEGKGKALKYYQAGVVAAVCLLGGAIIMFAEEIWLFIHKKEERQPEWKDMNKIKVVGGCVIALGVCIMILFILI